MHTFSDDNGVTIHHNSDYSGDALVGIPESALEGNAITVEIEPEGEDRTIYARIPASTLVKFARNATVLEAITALEELYR